jgi:hypothetical protein
VDRTGSKKQLNIFMKLPRKFSIRKIIFLLPVLSLFSACYYDNVDELKPAVGLFPNCDTTGTITYTNAIEPILKTNCGTTTACHSSTNTSGFDLSNYSSVKDQSSDGDLSNIILAITHDSLFTPEQWMPNNCGGCFLNQCSIEKIQAWVHRGNPE